ncbi:hypothetical protein [Schlesneria paludicola]|uniref:hypothetical protein n=1 Tax=Schlesneria paludicola TaxID=360056 RepID=UPI00029B3CB1|nr:hypothetical protein [Schlesneria paludicola]
MIDSLGWNQTIVIGRSNHNRLGVDDVSCSSSIRQAMKRILFDDDPSLAGAAMADHSVMARAFDDGYQFVLLAG